MTGTFLAHCKPNGPCHGLLVQCNGEDVWGKQYLPSDGDSRWVEHCLPTQALYPLLQSWGHAVEHILLHRWDQ